MQPISVYEDEHVQYALLPNGIHEFILKKPTVEALEGVFTQLEKLYPTIPHGETVRELVDGSSGSIPISKAVRTTRAFVGKRSDWPSVRTAVLSKDNLTLTVVQPIVHLLRMPKFALQFFKVEHRDEAIEWLLKGK